MKFFKQPVSRVLRKAQFIFPALLLCSLIFSGCGGNGSGGTSGLTATTGATATTGHTTGTTAVTTGTTAVTTGTTATTGQTGTTGAFAYNDLGTGIFPMGIDDAGDVLASANSGTTYELITNGVGKALPALPNKGTITAIAINKAGQVLVNSTVSGAPSDVFLLQSGKYTMLKRETIASKISQGVALSSNGMVLGTGNVIWTTPTTPKTFTAPANFDPLAINASGVVVGTSGTSYNSHYYKVLNNVATDLGVTVQASGPFAFTPIIATVDDAGAIAANQGDSLFNILPGAKAVNGGFGLITGTMNSAGLVPATTAYVYNPSKTLSAMIFESPDNYADLLNDLSGVQPIFVATYGINTSNEVVGTFIGSGNSIHLFTATLPAASLNPTTITVSVSGATNVEGGGNVIFNAEVSGTANANVAWTVVESGGGTIDVNGDYVAPLTGGTYHVKAVSQANNKSFGTAAINVVSIGGGGTPTYATPAAVAGPAGLTVQDADAAGQMVGFTATPKGGQPSALYWSSPTSTPVTLSDGGALGAVAVGVNVVAGKPVILGAVVQVQGGVPYTLACVWNAPTGQPTLLQGPYTFVLGAAGGINANGNIVLSNIYWSSQSAQPIALNSANSGLSGISNLPYIVSEGNVPFVYLTPTGSPVQLPASSFGGIAYAINASGTIVGTDSTAGGESVCWSPTAFKETVLPAQISVVGIDIAYGIGDNGWIVGENSYLDGTSGIPIWKNTTGYPVDLRTMIPQGTGWRLLAGLFVLSDGSVIGKGYAPNSTTLIPVYVKAG